MSCDALKLFRDIDAAKAVLLDFGEPFVVLELYVLLYHTDHDAKLLFVEHVTDCFAFNSPAFISRQHSKRSALTIRPATNEITKAVIDHLVF